MPEGYRNISVREDVYEYLNNLAKRNYRTLPQLLAYLLDRQKETLEKLLHIED